jgi:hypothetical protein
MWEAFRGKYQATKRSTQVSALGPLIALLDAYPPNGASTLDQISAEIRRIKGVRRFFSQNPAMKYLDALCALEDEVNAERSRVRTGGASESLEALRKNRERRSLQYGRLLATSVSEQDYIAPINKAFQGIIHEPAFATHFFHEVGWENARSWTSWAIRAATPAILAGAMARDLSALMREMSLKAGVGGKVYIERYFFELALYCTAAEEKADVAFVFSQASMIFGPLLGPLLHAPLSGAASIAAQAGTGAGRALVGFGAKAGLKAALVDDPEAEGIKQPVMLNGGGGVVRSINLMRYTHAWLHFVTEERETADTAIVLAEFGGKRGCSKLLELLSAM